MCGWYGRCVGASLSQARGAKALLTTLLAGAQETIGIGIRRGDDGWEVQVLLPEAPRDDHELPVAIEGVPIRYDAVGPITKR